MDVALSKYLKKQMPSLQYHAVYFQIYKGMIQSPRSNIRNASQRGSSASDAPPQNDNSEQAIAHRIFQSGNHAEIQAALSGSMGPAIQAAAAFLSSRQPSSPHSAPPKSSSPRLSWASPQPSSPHPNGPATAPSAAPTPSDLPASASPSASSAPDAASPSPSSAAPPQSAATPNPATPSAALSPADPSAASPAASSSPAPDAASPAPAQAADPLTSSAPPASAPAATPLAAEPPAAAPDVSPPLVYQPISSDISSRFQKLTGEDVSSVGIAENPDLETQGKRGVAIDGECIEVAPGLLGDLNLCAHELTHIVQQRGPLKQPSKSKKRSAEGEAKSAAKAVVADQKFPITVSSSESQLFEADDDADTQDNEQGSDTAGGEEGPSVDVLSDGTLDCDSSGCDSPQHAASQPEPEPEITKKIDEPCLTPCMKAGREDGISIPYDTSTLEGTYLANAEADYQRQQNLKYANQTLNGCFQGDLIDNPTGFNTLGQTACSVFPPADVRDVGVAANGIRQGKEGAWTDLALSSVGFVPFAGDAIKAVMRPLLRSDLHKINLNSPPTVHPHHNPRPDPANIDADGWPSSSGGPPSAAQSGDLVNNAESLADTKKAGETTSPNTQRAEQTPSSKINPKTDLEIKAFADTARETYGPGSCDKISRSLSSQIEGSTVLKMSEKGQLKTLKDKDLPEWGDIHYGVLLPDGRMLDAARGPKQTKEQYFFKSEEDWRKNTLRDDSTAQIKPDNSKQSTDPNQTSPAEAADEKRDIIQEERFLTEEDYKKMEMESLNATKRPAEEVPSDISKATEEITPDISDDEFRNELDQWELFSKPKKDN